MAGFPKEARLLSKREYTKVFNNKDVFRKKAFIVYCCKNGLSHARLGLAVSKKSIASAVKRNRLKRIIRESFRNSKHNAHDYVVVVTPKIKYHNDFEVRVILDSIWEQLRGKC